MSALPHAEIEEIFTDAHDAIEEAAAWWRRLNAAATEPRPTLDDLRAEIEAQLAPVLELQGAGR